MGLTLTLPKLPMLVPCSHYRYERTRYDCGLGGECKPIQSGPDLSACPKFHSHRSAAPIKPAPCIHLGEPTGATVLCQTCKGHVELKTYACTVHGSCTLGEFGKPIAGCKGCKNRASFPDVETRNLLYHVYPIRGNGVWQWNVEELLRRMGLFNGRRIVGIATDNKTDSADAVKRAFAGAVDEFVCVPNDPNLREVATFQKMLPMLDGTQKQATFFGHSKGVTSRKWAGDAVKLWAETSYETCLDYWPTVAKSLQQFPVTGPFKRNNRGWKESKSNWHYSGSFFWFNNAPLFARNWQHIEQFYGGIESYPGVQFSAAEAGELFYSFVRPGEDTLYKTDHWNTEMKPLLRTWKEQHREDYSPPEPHDSTKATIDAFHRLYYDRGMIRQGTWTSTFWRGVPVEKCPLDLHVYQELIHELKPDLIIETGTKHGGSALFLADMCQLVGNGRVATIDINAPKPPAFHPLTSAILTFIQGSSTAPDVIATVQGWAAKAKCVLVILDSDHRKPHVMEELRAYAPLVTPGSYIVCEDTNVNGNPIFSAHGPGPSEAVEAFLAENHDFERDRSREKFLLTFNPGGYLKRLR